MERAFNILPSLLISGFALGLLASASQAQIGVLTLPVGTGSDPRSVCVIAGGTHVVVSNQVDGWQHFVKVTAPAFPALVTSYNPPFGDQWFEAEYTPDNNGRLFTAHRGGGLNMIDVSTPAAPVTVASVSPPTVTYHYRGMRYRRNGADGLLYFNETNRGLGVYDVTGGGTALTLGWNNYLNNGINDGNGMEIVGNHLYQFGTGPSLTTTRNYRAFSLAVPNTPAPTSAIIPIPLQLAGGHTQLRMQPLTARMIASRWGDGLDIVDANPTALVRQTLIPNLPGINCWGATPFPNSPLAIAYGTILIGSVRIPWWAFLIVPPAGPSSILAVSLPNFDTHDIAMDATSGRVYVVGINPTNGRGELWIF
jgi:hypothetical protein